MDACDYANGCTCRFYQICRSHFQLEPAFACTHVNVRELHRRFVDENGKVLLESKRTATATDVTCQRSQILERNGIDFLVAAYFCSAFQIYFEVAWYDANEIANFIAMHKNRLENLIDVFAQAVGHMLCTEVVFIDLVRDKFV